MFNLHASDILQHWSVTHALAVQQTSERTLRDMKRLPSHLIQDVNAHGLPNDVITFRPAANRSKKVMPAIKSIRLIDA